MTLAADLDDPVPISALQHAVYCLRQAALIHIERLWEENRFTAEGRVLHDVAHEAGERKGRRGVRRVTALPVACRRLNIAGVADLVEFHAGDGGETAFPVEYKRGKPKLHRADEVQLCAQALCLEEMTGRPVPEGALFYGETKRRLVVPFDAELRRLTEETAAAFGCPGRAGAHAAAGLARQPLPCLLADRTVPSEGDGQVRARLQKPRARGRPRRRHRRVYLVKKLLNTLYATTEGASLRKDGENLVAEIDGAERSRVPLHMLGSVVVFGGIFISPPLIGALARAGITLVLLDRQGRFEARVEGPVSGNVLLRRAQYRAAEQPDDIVRSIVSAKVANQRTVLQRALRDHGAEMPVEGGAAIEATRRTGWSASCAASLLRMRERKRYAAPRARPPTVISACSANLIRSPDPDICVPRPQPPAAARSRQCAAFVPLHAAGPRLPQCRRERRPRSCRRLPASRPARPAKPCARPDGGAASGAGRPAGAVAAQPAAVAHRRLRDPRRRRRAAVRRPAARRCSRRGRSARRRNVGIRSWTRLRRSASSPICRRNCSRVTCAAILTPIRRGSGNRRARANVGARHLRRQSDHGRAARSACAGSRKPARTTASGCSFRCSRSRSIRRNGPH